MADYAIDVKDLRKSYKSLEVLKGINLKVERGTMLALLGPNGAGKTTTVRILSTLLRPDGGSAKIEGLDVVHQADEVRSVIGLTGQYAAVDEYLTGRENLIMMGQLYHLSAARARQRASELLDKFDLVEAADRPSKNYSGGMRRRLDLAASLIAAPPIIFLDEPTTGLDPRSRLAVWDIVRQLMAEGTTILLTTQYLEEADQLADKIAVMSDGVIAAEGTADELKAKIGGDRIEFVIGRSSSLSKARSVLDGEDARVDEAERTIIVGSRGGAKELYALLGKLNDAKIEVASVSLHKPSLDDVFLKITDTTKHKENA